MKTVQSLSKARIFFIWYWEQKLQDVGVRFVSLSRFQNEVAFSL